MGCSSSSFRGTPNNLGTVFTAQLISEHVLTYLHSELSSECRSKLTTQLSLIIRNEIKHAIGQTCQCTRNTSFFIFY